MSLMSSIFLQKKKIKQTLNKAQTPLGTHDSYYKLSLAFIYETTVFPISHSQYKELLPAITDTWIRYPTMFKVEL